MCPRKDIMIMAVATAIVAKLIAGLVERTIVMFSVASGRPLDSLLRAKELNYDKYKTKTEFIRNNINGDTIRHISTNSGRIIYRHNTIASTGVWFNCP